jgi:hypothetical protein
MRVIVAEPVLLAFVVAATMIPAVAYAGAINIPKISAPQKISVPHVTVPHAGVALKGTTLPQNPRSGSSGAVGAAQGGNSSQQLLNATKQMQETQMSFNLQYLQLQSQMQNQNRSYTAVSNIMKTKHDTVKNSIGNVR